MSKKFRNKIRNIHNCVVFIITQFITSLNRLLIDVCLSLFGIRFNVSVVVSVSVAIADASVSPCIDVR